MRTVLFILLAISLFITSCKSSSDETPTVVTPTILDIPVVKSGWDIYVAGSYEYGPSIIINDDKTIDAWFATSGGVFGQYLYPDFNSASNTAVSLTGSTTTAAQRFTATKSFYSIGVCCPTWSTTDGNMTLTLYNWNTDYNTTISGNPIATKTFIGFADNQRLTLSNDNLFPTGNYLWVLSQPENTVGVWKYSDNTSGTQSYLNGNPVDGSYKAILFPTNKVTSFWDQIAYKKSTDGGKTWTKEQIVLKPTMGSRDQLSVCDPGVAKWGNYYYLGYTSTENSQGKDNHAYVCRSMSPSGPWEKWNGSGWGGDKPQPVITYTGDTLHFGAGEPCMVVNNGTIFFYYSWDDTANTTRVSTADVNDANWPANLKYQGTAIDKTSITGSDHCDVKYRNDLKKFQAIHTASRMTANSYIVIWESSDGINFTKAGELHNNLKPYLHNCGWSANAEGQINAGTQQYLSYAYGSTWGVWNTYWNPLILKE